MKKIEKMAVTICLILTLAIGFMPTLANAAGETTLGSQAVGTIVKLDENGVPTNYIVVQQGNPDPALYDSSCNGTWLLRQEIFEQRQWHSDNVNDYANSTIHSYLNKTFLYRLSSDIQNGIKQVKIPYRAGSGSSTTVSSGASGLSTKVFLLSGYEAGWTQSMISYFPVDGSCLSYFSGTAVTDSKRISYLNGKSIRWWLRSPYTSGSSSAWIVSLAGSCSGTGCGAAYGVRPALVLPSTFLVTNNGSVIPDTTPSKAFLGDQSVGTTVKLSENGVPTNYIVVQQGNPDPALYDSSCNGTWLLREEIFEQRQWHWDNINDYASSTIHSYLNSTFIARFSSNIQGAIKQVKIPYRAGSGSSPTVTSGANGLSTRIFLLSGYETGVTSGDNLLFPADGSKLDYFMAGTSTAANTTRISNLTGKSYASLWWLRSPLPSGSYGVWMVHTDGSYHYNLCSKYLGVRPAFVLSSTLLVSDDRSVTTDTAPSVPSTVSVPETANGGGTEAISWAASTDAEDNLAGYILERSVDGGTWTQIYQGTGASFTDNITYGWSTVYYRVKAYDSEGLESDYKTSAAVSVVNIASYTVAHYRQNVGDDGYALYETDTLQGQAGTTANAAAKSYGGFHENTSVAGRVANGQIALDGSLALRLYYDRDTYTVSFDSSGGNAVSAQNGIRFGGLAVVPANPVKAGYLFDGWYTDAALSATYDFNTPITAGITLYAKWEPRTDSAYQVEHYQQNVEGDGYTLYETESLQDSAGTVATAIPKAYAGFHENTGAADRAASGTVSSDGTLILKLYYDRDTYTVIFDSDGGEPVSSQSGIRYGNVVVEPPTPSKIGNTFTGWYSDSGLTMPWDFSTGTVTEDKTLYAKWVSDSGTSYRVEHYQQNAADNGYTLFETETLQGTTGAEVTATAKTYTGFHENINIADRMASGTVASNSSLVLKLYYDRDTYTVAFESSGGNAVPSQNDIQYGTVVVEPSVPTKTGYTFAGWYSDSDLTTLWNFSTATVAKDTTLYAKWVSDSGLSLSTVAGNQYYISLNGNNIPSFNGQSYTLTYDQTVLEVTDLCGFTYEQETTAGTIARTGITITSFTPGEIVFTIDKPIPSGNVWSGVLNTVQFKALADQSTTISVHQ